MEWCLEELLKLYLENRNLGIESAEAFKGESVERPQPGIVPVDIKITFTGRQTTEQEVRRKVETDVKRILTNYEIVNEHYAEPVGTPVNYELTVENGQLVATVHTFGISRHPTQLYESITCILIFLLLLAIWSRYKEKTPEGLLFGLFLILIFGLRFFHELFKENQEAFEDDLVFNMGQTLSFPLIALGLIVLVRVYVKSRKNNSPTS